MHQELDANGLSHVRGQAKGLLAPCLCIAALMEKCLQDVAVAIGYVSILPIECDDVGRVIPVPEAQRGIGGQRSKLLIE